jgi:two-component system NtrC family sensor kinase
MMADEVTAKMIEKNILIPEGLLVFPARDAKQAEDALNKFTPDLMILADDIRGVDHIEFAKQALENEPTLPIILFTKQDSVIDTKDAIQLGLVDWLEAPVNIADMHRALRVGLSRAQNWRSWLKREASRYTDSLRRQVDELEHLAEVGQVVTGLLDLDVVLTKVVEAAVDVTGADEGSLLLLEEDTGTLVMRAAKNFNDDFVRTFRVTASDSLINQVIETGEPILIDSDAPHKITTGLLVKSMIYVPLKISGKVFGVLGVDNRMTSFNFTERHVTLLSMMADYASVAIENAKLYTFTMHERYKLERILTQIKDGVLVYSPENRIMLVNNVARKALGLGDDDLTGMHLDDLISDLEMASMLMGHDLLQEFIEIDGEDKRIYHMRVLEIEGVGSVATFHDISYFKELDKMKTEFVSTVSHDLRSPLTAIMGYISLIKRVGDVNVKQDEFIDKVEDSVRSITSLIDNLLNLGRLEIGGFGEAELVDMNRLIRVSVDQFEEQIAEREQQVIEKIEPWLPSVVGYPIQLRQMVDNLIGNAIKFTQEEGRITVEAKHEKEQLIIRISDDGPGIPWEEHTKIFDKFYRAKGTVGIVDGTGLGLAITKSVVTNHRGRIWVDSEPGKGATFIIVLPVAPENSIE